jgi:cytochrome c-type biogenesis protein CcmH
MSCTFPSRGARWLARVALAALAAAVFAAAPAPAWADDTDECAEGGVSGTAPPESLSITGGGISLAQVNAVADRLICICGCGNMVLGDCECGVAAKDKARIHTLLAEGKSPDAVVAIFVEDDGEQRLAAPTKQGFNLVAWVAPFVALVLGGTFLGWVLRSWTRRAPKPAPGTGRPAAPEDSPYRERLDEELRRGA